MSVPQQFIDAALRYHRAGLKVVPVYSDGKNHDFGAAWKRYQTGPQTETDVLRDFSRPQFTRVDGTVSPFWGIAILCTDGMEVIDIDTKADPFKKIDKEYFEEVFWSTGTDELLKRCTTVRTKSGGWHLIYRTDKPSGNRKLTTRKDSPEAVIETRGTGGLIFAAPTPGYKLIYHTYEDIATISTDERDTLIGTALRLSDSTPDESTAKPPREVRREYTPRTSNEDLTPWDDFNAQHDVRDIIERHGWQEIPRQENDRYWYYTKPGGTAGNIHAAVVKDSNIFLPFTTATEFEDFKGYTAYAALTLLEHYGDYSASAKALRSQGYGANMDTQAPGPAKEVQTEKAPDDLWQFVRSTRFSIHNPPKEEDAILNFHFENRAYKVGGKGMLGAVVGAQKSGKSLITSCIVSSILSGRNQMGLSLENSGKRKIFFDTEQSLFFYGKTQERIYQMAGLRDDPTTYETYHLRRLSILERVKAIEMVLQQPGEIELIVIDGLVDICENFNEERASIAAVDNLLRWSDTSGAMLITVLHTTKAMGYMRGHLGTALQNKCDFAFEVKKDPELNEYTVKCRESRFAPFPTWTFERDENGFPYRPDDERDEPEPDEYAPQPTYNATAGMTPAGDDDEIPF